ncbi:MAG: hypothetical protein IJL02_12195 [Methanobrevibacter sp.]|uniref:hypothetical protein n=1 Tax=Methanobrevibacter sp. TaxID=66852 RepID=UPI0025F7D266|nr:hypothetical protein [Methanobrevibacter sp.]MBQ6100577.1 hypothetical protein [Methanobrevibacter sp.]MBQ6100608.1 hypothetical protein [Methanobrevibacter sp.]
MIEKIEITQRFNFKRLNRHYECFTIDFLNSNGYYKISERGSGDKFLSESPLCDKSWIDILVDLRSKMTSEIRTFDFENANQFLHDFNDLNLFENFESEKFLYFEKLELIYSCIVIIYSDDGYYEYSFKNNFPKDWVKFGEILQNLVGFDVLHLNYQKQFATPLYHEIKCDGVYFDGEKLKLKTIEFGHYRTYPYDLPHPRLIIDFKNKTVDGYIEKKLDSNDENLILNLLEKYHVYAWILGDYHRKSQTRDPDDLEGYDWYLELVFEGNVIWHLFGYNDYPDTYVHLGREIIGITDMDLLEIGTISPKDTELFNKFGDKILLK